MSSRILCIALLGGFSLLKSFISTGQDRAAKTWQHDKKNCHFLLSNTNQCNWQFFEIKRKLNGIIVTIDKPPVMQKVVPVATVCIVATSKDTVRVIVEGVINNNPGDKITFTPAKEPEYDVQVSFDREYYFSEEKKKNNPTCRVNMYDQLIKRTTWGTIAKS